MGQPDGLHASDHAKRMKPTPAASSAPFVATLQGRYWNRHIFLLAYLFWHGLPFKTNHPVKVGTAGPHRLIGHKFINSYVAIV